MHFVDLVLHELEFPVVESRKDLWEFVDLNPHVARLPVVDRMHGQTVVLNRRENKFVSVEADISSLIKDMEASIAEANSFIDDMAGKQ